MVFTIFVRDEMVSLYMTRISHNRLTVGSIILCPAALVHLASLLSGRHIRGNQDSSGEPSGLWVFSVVGDLRSLLAQDRT